MNDRQPIDGELVREEPVQQLPAEAKPQAGLPAPAPEAPATPAPVMEFNPLDALPEDFAGRVQKRQQNYTALREYLRDMLVPDIDFGRIHIANKSKCPKPYSCTYEQEPYHFSGYQLFDPGADKVKDLLGLRVAYDDVIGKYQNASLKGVQIPEVILRCYLLGPGDVRVCEGAGSCNVQGEAGGNLSNAIKKAQKRARVDAIKRLPGVSALFDDDFLGSIKPPPAPRQTRQPRPTRTDQEHGARQGSPGRVLETIPMGKNKGKRWSDPAVDVGYLKWVMDKMTDKPDMIESARAELQRRQLQEPLPDQPRQQTQPAGGERQPPADNPHGEFISAAFTDLDDDMPPLDAY